MRSHPSSRRRSGRVITLALLGIVTACCSAGVMHRYRRATDPHLSLGEWEDSSVWWQQGKCTECHRQPLTGEAGNPHIAGAEPKSHRNPTWRWNHGRSEEASESRCYTCHKSSSCQACHRRRPEDHTEAYMHPASRGPDATRHALFARLEPSSCLVCHGSLITGCAKCHAPGETQQWQDEAMERLSRWPSLLQSTQKDTEKQLEATIDRR